MMDWHQRLHFVNLGLEGVGTATDRLCKIRNPPDQLVVY